LPGRDVLGRVVTSIGGRVYPPRGARLDALWGAVADGQPDIHRTLAGCVIASRADGVLIVRREHAAVAGPTGVADGNVAWDSRYEISIADGGCAELTVDALGRAPAHKVREVALPRILALPADVRWALPGLFARGDLVAGPGFASNSRCFVRFAPRMPIAGAIFGGF
ncbi:MAG: hypothetical protein JJ899_08065, partial [Alphaproteobacteria bacterium]|nr:hypothetical protein [Alphaproteobacteria bacterium]